MCIYMKCELTVIWTVADDLDQDQNKYLEIMFMFRLDSGQLSV